MQVVNGVELGAQDFVAFVEVVQVGATEVLAGVAVAVLIQWRRIALVAVIAQFEHPRDVNILPLRALRVGITQSNISIPCARPPAGRPACPPHQVARFFRRQ